MLRPPFRSDQFVLCCRAYSAAFIDIQNQQGDVRGPPRADSTCAMIALRIIEASANGVHDLPGLKSRALVDLVVQH